MTTLEAWTEDLQYEHSKRLKMRLCTGENPPVIEIHLPDTVDSFGTVRHNSVIIPVQAIKKLLKGHLD
jgi:hypothetical protein